MDAAAQTGRSRMSTFVIHKAGDSTREGVMANALLAVSAVDPKDAWRIDIKRYRKRRSNDANEYLWSGVYPPMVRELGFTAEEWHEEMLIRYFGKVEHTTPGGRINVTPIRTTTTNENGDRDVLPGKDFWDFVEFIRRQASLAGVYIEEPDPFWKERREKLLKEKRSDESRAQA
jgi:hypothetical protein